MTQPVLSEAELWQVASQAMAIQLAEDSCGDDNMDDENVEQQSVCVAQLPDGDIHVCRAETCQYGEGGLDISGRPNGDVVCKYTGCVLRRVCEARTDTSTGRDMWGEAGDEHRSRQFCLPARRDARRASRAAYRSAMSMNDTDYMCSPILRNQDIDSAKNEKEAARPQRQCTVDKAKDVHQATQKRENDATLYSTPSSLDKQHKSSTGNKFKLSVSPDALRREATLVLDRLTQRLIKNQHDVVNNAQTYSVELRTCATTLAVVLWQCASATTYMRESRRARDGFRSFCVGIFYACKRGVTLPDGNLLIPKHEGLTRALNSRRSANTSRSMRALHQSSHRGLCTLHRCIASVPTKSVQTVFETAMRAADDMARCAH